MFKSPASSEPRLSNGAGKNDLLKLILDNHQSDVFGSTSGSFQLSLKQFSDSFDVTSDAIVLMPGQSMDVSVSVSILSTPTGESSFFIPTQPSQCQFGEDTPSKSCFKEYSHKSCQFECMLL